MPTGVINIDYVAFTLKEHTRPGDIIPLLGLDFEELSYGMRRYAKAARGVGHPGLVLWAGSEQNMGVHCVLSGEVLRIMECAPDFAGWERVLDTLRAVGATFTRIDIALDDLGGSITWESVRDAFVDGHVSCRAHSDSLKVHQTRHGSGWLSTLAVGSRTSERFLRTYEKCTAKGDAFDGLRFELECKAGYAEAAASALIDHGWAALAGMVAAFVTFTDPESSDATKSRRPAAAWWRDFVGSLRHVVDVAKVTTACIQRRYAHLKKQYSQTFHVLTSLLGGSTDWVYEFIDAGGERLNRVNRQLIRFWEKQNYVPNLAGS